MKNVKIHVDFYNLGLISYSEALKLQEDKFREAVAAKANRCRADIRHSLFFCEHMHVYTIGKSGKMDNLLRSPGELAGDGAEFFHSSRGGDITYHGPGQIVGYPVFDLEAFALGVKDYIFKLEECILRTLKYYKLEGNRLHGATGVWIIDEDRPPRKICAIGVKCSRYVTMHGFAFNINTDLRYFNYINPCGFTDKGVTSLKAETAREINLTEVSGVLLSMMAEVFGFVIDDR